MEYHAFYSDTDAIEKGIEVYETRDGRLFRATKLKFISTPTRSDEIYLGILPVFSRQIDTIYPQQLSSDDSDIYSLEEDLSHLVIDMD